MLARWHETIVWDSLVLQNSSGSTQWRLAKRRESQDLELPLRRGNAFWLWYLRSVCPMHVGLRIQIDAIPEGVKEDLAH